jgi:phosphoribosylamine--glycine ligase
VKQNGWGAKNLNYVPHFPDGKDSLAVLRTYASNPILRKEKITLQKKIVGIEIGVARYFNGKDWVGPIEVNIEHKKMFTGDLGPSTSEMGTLAWYDNSENRLFNETLGKLKPYLQEIDFRGDIDINCIVNDEGAYTLEATPRLGSPAIYIHAEIHESPWAEFLKAVADGKEYDLQWKSGFGIAVLLAVPPFPFSKEINEISPKNLPVYLEEAERVDKGKHLHFEGVSRDEKKPAGEYYVSDGQGYVAYITSLAPTVEEARQKAQRLVESVYIPKMFYRNDIGVAFVEKSAGALKSLKYL